MDAAKLQTIVDEVHAATSVATEIIAASGIGGNFNEALVERGEDAAFGIVKAALTGYTKATGKTLTPDDVTALLITDAPLEVDPALEAKVGGETPIPVIGQVDGVNTTSGSAASSAGTDVTAGTTEGAASGTTEGAAKEGSEPPQ